MGYVTPASLALALGVHPRIVVEMTLNVYGHVNLDSQREALDHLDEQLS